MAQAWRGWIGSGAVSSQADPGDAGWHIEGSFEVGGDWWVNYRSRARGLLALYLFSDVDAASAPTRVRPGSHRDAARVLAPAGDEGMPFPQAARLAARASAARPTVLATGQAGDVIVCHPFLVHAASWPHTGRHPRIMAQPGVALHDAFPLVPPLSPVELAMWPGRSVRPCTRPSSNVPAQPGDPMPRKTRCHHLRVSSCSS